MQENVRGYEVKIKWFLFITAKAITFGFHTWAVLSPAALIHAPVVRGTQAAEEAEN